MDKFSVWENGFSTLISGGICLVVTISMGTFEDLA